ncbi:MAG: DUF445 domain-containing protein [Pseudomonadota bacterium]
MHQPSQPDAPEGLSDADAAKTARLNKTRRMAEIVLIALVAVYLVTYLPSDPPQWLRLIRHMAEAGMIGGLADWFAVVALFRHPLGIPIPHTALLPRNQARAAESVGQFFKGHFLDPKSISTRVAEVAPARRAAEWLIAPANAALLAKPLTQAVTLTMEVSTSGKSTLNDGLRKELRAALASETATHGIATALGPVLEQAVHGPLMSDMLRQVRKALDGNRDRVLELVQDNSRWWVASRVDRGVSTVLVDGVLNVIDDLEKSDSALRKDFEDGLAGFVHTLYESGALERAVHDGKTRFTQSKDFDEAVDATLTLVRQRLAEGQDDFESAITAALQSFARKLLSDDAALATFEAQLTEAAEKAMVELREPIGDYVTDVIKGWEADELSERFEREIGPDLQFIRINGALLGALIGGVLFFAQKGLSQLAIF